MSSNAKALEDMIRKLGGEPPPLTSSYSPLHLPDIANKTESNSKRLTKEERRKKNIKLAEHTRLRKKHECSDMQIHVMALEEKLRKLEQCNI
jgi:hypothetical protein